MSQQNVELIRRSIEVFNERDADQLTALSHPECEWRTFRAQLEGTAYRGHDGIRRFLHDMDDDWSEFQMTPLQFHAQGNRVVATARISATGRGSGAHIDFVAGFHFELRDDLIARITSYSDAAEALKAAGLSE